MRAAAGSEQAKADLRSIEREVSAFPWDMFMTLSRSRNRGATGYGEPIQISEMAAYLNAAEIKSPSQRMRMIELVGRMDAGLMAWRDENRPTNP